MWVQIPPPVNRDRCHEWMKQADNLSPVFRPWQKCCQAWRPQGEGTPPPIDMSLSLAAKSVCKAGEHQVHKKKGLINLEANGMGSRPSDWSSLRKNAMQEMAGSSPVRGILRQNEESENPPNLGIRGRMLLEIRQAFLGAETKDPAYSECHTCALIRAGPIHSRWWYGVCRLPCKTEEPAQSVSMGRWGVGFHAGPSVIPLL